MPRCAATTAKGKPCKNHAVTGSDRCAVHLGKTGRATGLTDEVRERILNMLRAGGYVEVAVAAAGVGRSTYYEWLERGHPDGDPADQLYREFREQVERARAEGEGRLVALVSKEAATDWRAAAFMLERQYPERWGRPSQRKGDGDGGRGEVDPMDALEEPPHNVTPLRRP